MKSDDILCNLNRLHRARGRVMAIGSFSTSCGPIATEAAKEIDWACDFLRGELEKRLKRAGR